MSRVGFVVALLALFSAGCIVDEWGVKGTRFQLAEMARARKDGTLACKVVYDQRTRGPSWDVTCRYDAEAQVCNCRENPDRFDQPIMPAIDPGVSFKVRPCYENIPDGIDWPLRPSFVRMLRELHQLAAELGKELPKELDLAGLNVPAEARR